MILAKVDSMVGGGGKGLVGVGVRAERRECSCETDVVGSALRILTPHPASQC